MFYASTRLKCKPKLKQCKRFVLRAHNPTIRVTRWKIKRSTIFILSSFYTLRSVPHTYREKANMPRELILNGCWKPCRSFTATPTPKQSDRVPAIRWERWKEPAWWKRSEAMRNAQPRSMKSSVPVSRNFTAAKRHNAPSEWFCPNSINPLMQQAMKEKEYGWP